MSVSPPGELDIDTKDTKAVHVDNAQGTLVRDHGTQQNCTVGVTAGGDALVAGRDFHVQELHVHVENADASVPGGAQPKDVPGPILPPLARAAYLEQVQRIAPPELMDRHTEVMELCQFCLAAEGPSYAWWRAGPWAGKSALLSSFVLRPPADVAQQVRIVSFFITARLAAQDTRESFTQVLLEQLAALLGQSLPEVLPEATREAYLLDLLSQAAVKCREGGGRLVLVVDGLDEDRGVTTGPYAHSIAGLLPADPPAGMRVIVAGRLDPPVPDDVPDWHPLRAPAIIRQLTASSHARDLQRLSKQELRRLLRGSEVERSVLGLLASARGGLTARDIADLARRRPVGSRGCSKHRDRSNADAPSQLPCPRKPS